MAATQPPVAAASCWGGCSGGDVSVQMPPAPPADAYPEKQLSLFVRCVASGEWAGNAFGALAFGWATVVILGGFCSELHRQDFWSATVMIFIEGLRIFSRNYKLDSQSLFGTTRALRWMNSSFLRMLGQPQEGDEVVLIMGLWLKLIGELPFVNFIIDMALLIPWSRRPGRPQQWNKRAVAIAYLIYAAYKFIGVPIWISRVNGPWRLSYVPIYLVSMLLVIIEGVAVLLLYLRPRSIAKLTSSQYGRKLIFLAKFSLALGLATYMLPAPAPVPVAAGVTWPTAFFDLSDLAPTATLLVLSLGSLQDNNASHSLLGRWIDTIIHIFFLLQSVPLFPLGILEIFIPGSISSLPPPAIILLPYVFQLVFLLIGNLQIPAAAVQILLSSLRLSNLRHDRHMGYDSPPSGNMVPAIAVFYVLALCQGSLYIMASILGLFSWIPRRWLMRKSKLGGELGAQAIDLYYEHAYATRMEMGVFGTGSGSATRMEMGVFGTGSGSTFSFANFAIKSLNSNSRDLQDAGLCVLHNILSKRTDRRTEDDAVVQEVAGLCVLRVPGMLKMVSSRLTDDVASANGGSVQSAQGSNGGCTWSCSWFCGLCKWMKPECCSVPEEPNLSDLPVLGMEILEKLARDPDNCAEIFKDNKTNLISKTIGIIGNAITSDNNQNDALLCSSLEFLRRLATTGERIGVELRHELWSHPFLLTSLARALELEDDRSSSSSSRRHLQIWEPAMDIIAKLALHKEAGLHIGKIKVITARLLQAFLGRHGATNMYYDQSLRKVSGEALANLALWGTANSLVILDEPGYQVIHDLKTMLSEDEHNRYVAASLLLNLCAHCHSVNLLLSHPHAREHLSSALTTTCTLVKEHMNNPMKDDAEGKQLESLINLASEIGDVTRDEFVSVLESQNNSGAELVQNLLHTLDSKTIPNPAYPRMRRAIVKILISILESCHRTVEKLVEDRMAERLMDSLTKIQRSPSTVEEYRVFYGNIGVVLEDGEPMSTLVARAKVLLVQRTTQTAGAPIGHHYP